MLLLLVKPDVEVIRAGPLIAIVDPLPLVVISAPIEIKEPVADNAFKEEPEPSELLKVIVPEPAFKVRFCDPLIVLAKEILPPLEINENAEFKEIGPAN